MLPRRESNLIHVVMLLFKRTRRPPGRESTDEPSEKLRALARSNRLHGHHHQSFQTNMDMIHPSNAVIFFWLARPGRKWSLVPLQQYCRSNYQGTYSGVEKQIYENGGFRRTTNHACWYVSRERSGAERSRRHVTAALGGTVMGNNG